MSNMNPDKFEASATAYRLPYRTCQLYIGLLTKQEWRSKNISQTCSLWLA